jgi:hypothetical protein
MTKNSQVLGNNEDLFSDCISFHRRGPFVSLWSDFKFETVCKTWGRVP